MCEIQKNWALISEACNTNGCVLLVRLHSFFINTLCKQPNIMELYKLSLQWKLNSNICNEHDYIEYYYKRTYYNIINNGLTTFKILLPYIQLCYLEPRHQQEINQALHILGLNLPEIIINRMLRLLLRLS